MAKRGISKVAIIFITVLKWVNLDKNNARKPHYSMRQGEATVPDKVSAELTVTGMRLRYYV